MILRRKLFSKKEDEKQRKLDLSNKNDRVALRSKSDPRSVAQSEIMFEDGDATGRIREAEMIRKHGKRGILVGTGLGIAGTALAARKGVLPEGLELLPVVGGMTGGAIVGAKIGSKKGKKARNKVWNKGDEEELSYLRAPEKEKREVEKNYIPIYYRVDKNGDPLDEKDFGPWDKTANEERIQNKMALNRVTKAVDLAINKERKRYTKKEEKKIAGKKSEKKK